MNTIGKRYTLTSFGESHGPATGGIIDGCPAGFPLSIEEIQRELDRRKPGQSDLTTSRSEEDKVEILSGLFEGVTTGMPIGFMIPNRDAKSGDYDHLKELYRPSHADYTAEKKYGIRDHRGGGRFSAREHAARVVAGAIARQILRPRGISIRAYTSRIGPVEIATPPSLLDLTRVDTSPVRCPDETASRAMEALVRDVKAASDSIGGIVTGIISGLPAGLGEPVFDRFQARLAYYMMGINAAKGFEYGEGFHAALLRGSEHNDPFAMKEGRIVPLTNRAGGILGGITNGEEILFRVAFKPASTIGKEQNTVNRSGEEITLRARGRHDPCVVPRAVPVVEAMAAILVLDMMLEAARDKF